MARTIHNLLSTLAVGALLSISSQASAGNTGNDESRWSGDLRYSVYHIAAENEAAKAAGQLQSGQAGRAGPASVPGGRIEMIDASDIRFSIYDRSGRDGW